MSALLLNAALRRTAMAESKTLRLILGDQLNENHSWFSKSSDRCDYVIMEVRQETDYVKHHIQKIAGFFAAMRAFAERLSEMGHRVIYVRLDDPKNRQSFEENIRQLLKKNRYGHFEYQLPDEYRLDRQLAKMASRLPVTTAHCDSEHFLTGRQTLSSFFKGKKRFLMESFYREMRKRHGILMEDGRPAGGKWNYDRENRSRYDGKVPLPAPKVFDNDVGDITTMIRRAGVKTFGDIEPKHFIWPVNRRQALALLSDFVKTRLRHFGTYQDAMTCNSWSLFHSRLSFALNCKLLHPMEVIRSAVKSAAARGKNSVTIAQLEGFVRQILGWREYMRGIYWAFMPGFAEMNFFDHRAALPGYYWTADTKMHCIRSAVRQSLQHAYAHHIQRLMITGNFALLAGIHPDEVDAWYLGIYIDAIQWVEIVNTRGMSQFADGGITATKPYVSSANYVRKMSDYCGDCHYRHERRSSERACPFNSLYWDFFERHREKLQTNPRIGVMYRTWDRMPAKERKAVLTQARAYKDNLEDL
jgi:deoxyribodipyrimidine photolyase-related protein